MNKVVLTKEEEENIINEGVFGIAMNALGRAIGNRAGAAAATFVNVAKKSVNYLTSQDKTHPNYDPTNDENSPHFNPNTYNPSRRVQSNFAKLLQISNEHNNPNSANYKPSANTLMMQQLNQQNASQ